jgi:Xaa-Pro aminopeptidase
LKEAPGRGRGLFFLHSTAHDPGIPIHLEWMILELKTIELKAMDYPARQRRLAAYLRDAGVSALLVTHLPNIRYLCGFTGSAGVLLLIAGARGARLTFYTDGRYTQQASDEVMGARVVIAKKSALLEACEAAVKARVKTLGFEADQLQYVTFQQLSHALRGKLKLKPTNGVVEHLRMVKDADEIEQIRAAVLLGSSLFPAALAAIRPGVAETAVAGELELHARRAGAEKMSFDTIVASGSRSALPHGRASGQAVPDSGFIILDYGVILAGYCSDMTRTVHVGRVSDAHRRMYQAVKDAQLASIEAVRPGVAAGKVDQAGRDVLKKAGYEAFFIHSTGHGVGIEIHEQPRIAKGQVTALEPGMVITIEPGIYIPDDGGVRIEDMVLVTETGHEVLTPTDKNLITL